jgi:hypothetical protein
MTQRCVVTFRLPAQTILFSNRNSSMWRVSVPDFTAEAAQSASFDLLGADGFPAPKIEKKPKEKQEVKQKEQKRPRPEADEPTNKTKKVETPVAVEKPRSDTTPSKKRKILSSLLEESKAVSKPAPSQPTQPAHEKTKQQKQKPVQKGTRSYAARIFFFFFFVCADEHKTSICSS